MANLFTARVISSEEALTERALAEGIQLPQTFVTTFAAFNGAAREGYNIFDAEPEERVDVDRFLDLSDPADWRTIKAFMVDFGYSHLVPFAQSMCGDYICIDTTNGSVWFVDHDLCGYPEAAVKLTNGFSEFVEKLVSFE